jgi:quercetin dioxygenase-like cupin family protein
MQQFQFDVLVDRMNRGDISWMEFLRVDALSMGLYTLKAGARDGQRPHQEDEVYYVIAGKAKFRAGNEVWTAQPGAIFYVGRLLDHKFFEIESDLTMLVFFAPAESSCCE